MRVVALLLLGFFIGVLGTVSALSALRQDTPYSSATMTVLRQQVGGLSAMRDAGTCDVAESRRRLQVMQAVGGEIDAAFLPIGDDDLFREHRGAMQSRLADALANPPADCAALATTLTAVGGTCKACHEDFR